MCTSALCQLCYSVLGLKLTASAPPTTISSPSTMEQCFCTRLVAGVVLVSVVTAVTFDLVEALTLLNVLKRFEKPPDVGSY